MTMSDPPIPPRTILRSRPCKFCAQLIYLQYIPVTEQIQWIAFNINGKLHECTTKPFDSEIKNLIQKPLESVNLTNYNNSRIREVVHRLDMIIENLSFIKQNIIIITSNNSI